MGRGIGFIPDALFCIHISFECSYEDALDDLKERDRETYLEKLARFKTFASKRAYVEMHPFQHSEKEIWEWVSELENDEITNIRLNLSHISVHDLESKYSFSRKNQIWDSKWSAEFNGEGILLAENRLIQLVGIISTDHHVAVGVVRKYEESDFIDDYYQENSHKENWYDARNLSFEEICEIKGKKLYDNYCKKCEKMADDIQEKIHETYPYKVRTSAWTMSPVIPYRTSKKIKLA